ncbi:MAG: hypothetical protein AAF327_06715 [Cyanobacteria bacterium P01_A01_bin.37]
MSHSSLACDDTIWLSTWTVIKTKSPNPGSPAQRAAQDLEEYV